MDDTIQVGKLKAKVLRDVCIGAATCVAVSPAVFQLDSEKKAVIQKGGNDSGENILAAAQSCPVRAIVVTDVETGKQLWPE